MKCESCGKRLKKSDEICPECGKYITRKKTGTPSPEAVPAEPVRNENEFIFKDNIPLLIFKLFTAVVFIGICIYTFIKGSPSDFRDIILSFASIFICVDAFAVFFQERGCRLTFDNDRAHGTVPGGKFGKKEISIAYDEILNIEFVIGSKYSPSHVSVLLKTGNAVKIPCTRKKTLIEIEERLQARLTEIKISNMNTTVVYIGETAEGELINGKEYTLVEIDEDGMYEVIDESGETGFYYPEFFKTTDSE